VLLTEAREPVSRASTAFLRALGRERPLLGAFATEAARILAEPGSTHPVRRGASTALDDALDQLEYGEAWQGRYLDRLRQQAGLERVKVERSATQGLFLEVPVNTLVPAD